MSENIVHLSALNLRCVKIYIYRTILDTHPVSSRFVLESKQKEKDLKRL